MKSAFSRFFWPAAMLLGLIMNTQAVAQSGAKRTAAVVPAVSETEFKKNVFAGNEVRIAAMNNVNADCTAGPLPDIRIVSAPSKGEVRFETIKFAVDRDKKNHRFHCNGKLVDALGVFYKAKDDTGRDRLTVDVDFKTGIVRRYIFTVDIR